MSLIGNLLWFFLGGGWSLGLSWVFSGILCCCTIVGIPFGVACFRIAGFAFFPFGKKLVPSPNAGVCTAALNIVWIIFIGLWLAIGQALLGILYCCTIIGIPFGLACFRLAAVSFAPLGKTVVPN